MCKKAVQEYSYLLEFALDCFKAGEICKEAVNEYSYKL